MAASLFSETLYLHVLLASFAGTIVELSSLIDSITPNSQPLYFFDFYLRYGQLTFQRELVSMVELHKGSSKIRA